MRASSYLLPLLLGCTALAGCVVAPQPGQLAPGQYVSVPQGQIVSAGPTQYGNTGEVTEPPPPLPDYEQPPIPAEGYIWTPGFWQYGRSGYYWVPGAWVEPPSVGLLWTPGYWAFSSGYYRWNPPYWGPSVGYYGGINYGFGYFGIGYEGGRWDGGRFHYNQSVNNFGGRRISNSYNAPVRTRGDGGRASFNGPNGTRAQPGPGQHSPGPDQRRPPTPAQTQHFQSSQGNGGFQSRGNPGLAPNAPSGRPSGQLPGQGTPQRQNFGQQPNYAPQQRGPAAQAPQAPQRPPAAQQAAPPARQAPAADTRPTQRPQQQQQYTPPPSGRRPPLNSQERG